jgi:hypothetical protein
VRHLLVALLCSGCFSSIEARPQVIRVEELRPLVTKEPGPPAPAVTATPVGDGAVIDLRLESRRPCVVSQVARSRALERRTYVSHDVPGALVCGLLATTAAAVVITALAADGDAKNIKYGLSFSVPVGLFGIIATSRGLYHAAKDGDVEVGYGEIEKHPAEATASKDAGVCDTEPLPDVEVALVLRDKGGAAHTVRGGATDPLGLVRIDVARALAKEYPGWPAVEAEVDPKAAVVLVGSQEVVGAIDLARYPALRFGEHTARPRP